MLDYRSLQITTNEALDIAEQLYQLTGEICQLPGFVDFNFKLKTNQGNYILKISRPDADKDDIEFQQKLLMHLQAHQATVHAPQPMLDQSDNFISRIQDKAGNTRFVRLLTWVEGRIWAEVNPHSEALLHSLGEQLGNITQALEGFDHPMAHRSFEWDLAQAAWTYSYIHLFDDDQQKIAKHFKLRFKSIQAVYQQLRKGVLHNDANDYNSLVTNDLQHPKVSAIIDYGDAIHSQLINDLAIAISYAVMNKPDVLSAALPVVKGFHSALQLQEKELECLYVLVAMRLITSVTKAAINRQEEPENTYLFVSEKPAWEVLRKWQELNENFAHYSFRQACGYAPHPQETSFHKWSENQQIDIATLFPSLKLNQVHKVDMSVASTWLGHEIAFLDNKLSAYKIHQLQREHPEHMIAGGYLETRPFYITDAYKKEGNNGPEYRAIHLGVDFWVDNATPIHAFADGRVVCLHNNAFNKDYGPTLILEHQVEDDLTFYSLYGHLTESSLALHQLGDTVKKDDLIAYVGADHENGNWVPHLHFQLMLDLLGNELNFPGVAFPKQLDVWTSICPDPNLLFRNSGLASSSDYNKEALISYRKQHLGKSMSLSYQSPLSIVRGSGVYLIADDGRKYLDTVNNVAHVGHEHPAVVKAGQEQMAILNTNTRYLHPSINEFAEELLSTFPEELSVVHFVNSGSEANELALRMAYTATQQRDIIAVEVGYHGNTNACVGVSSYKFEGKGGVGAPKHTHIVPLPDRFRGMYKGKNMEHHYVKHVQSQIDFVQQEGRNVAAFICESIISCGGQIELPRDYLKEAYAAIRKAGGICIADEVQTGCGRVGAHFWAFQLHDVVPDIVTIGKPIGNGHPLAAVVCTQAVAAAFANGMEFFNTFGGNPVSCAIGKQVLQTVRTEGLQESAWKVGNYLKNGLKKLQEKFPIIAEVRGQGLFLGFELVDKQEKPLAAQASYLANRMKTLGILMSTDGRDHNVLKIKPPMVFSIENADEFLARLAQVFQEDFMKL